MLILSDNPSPKGFGLNARDQKINLIKRGTDGKIWIVKNFNGIKRWAIHDYYKEFKKSELKLLKLMEKSIINFQYSSTEHKLLLNQNYFKNQIKDNTKIEDLYFPSITINIKVNSEFDKIFAPFEYKMLCFKSGFYKYTIQAGHDSLIKNKKLKEVNYYYDVAIDCKIWKDFEKEYKKSENQIIEVINNITEIIEKLPKKKQEYIYKNYMQ